MSFEWQECGYGCGKRWRPFAGTVLKGHAKCALRDVRAEFERANHERDERGYPRTERDLASRFGVSIGIVRAWRAVIEGGRR